MFTNGLVQEFMFSVLLTSNCPPQCTYAHTSCLCLEFFRSLSFIVSMNAYPSPGTAQAQPKESKTAQQCTNLLSQMGLNFLFMMNLTSFFTMKSCAPAFEKIGFAFPHIYFSSLRQSCYVAQASFKFIICPQCSQFWDHRECTMIPSCFQFCICRHS